LPFVSFWFELLKDTRLVEFFDTLLLNFRKHRDTYKLQLVAELRHLENYEMKSEFLKDVVNDVLKEVLKTFYRISQSQESDEEQFPIEVYRDIVHDNYLIDVAKLFDIAAIFGQSNSEVVRQLIANVFENDKRFIQEYKESIDTILGMFKKAFTTSQKISDMIRGEQIIERTRSEQD
jgi:dsRNA-specific ribonuclease